MTIETPGSDVALLVIDVQNDFCPGGALEVGDGDAVVPVINGLLDGYTVRVFSQDWHPADHFSFASNHAEADDGPDGTGAVEPYSIIQADYGPQVLWPDHCVQATSGAEFHPDLRVDRADMIVRKGFRPHIDSYSAFFENDHVTPTGLDGYLRSRGVNSVVVVGLATDFCVRYTAVDAAAAGYDVTVLTEASRAIDLDGSLADAHAAMTAAGVTLA